MKTLSLVVTEKLTEAKKLNIFSKFSEPRNIGHHQIRFTGFCWASPDVSVCQV